MPSVRSKERLIAKCGVGGVIPRRRASDICESLKPDRRVAGEVGIPYSSQPGHLVVQRVITHRSIGAGVDVVFQRAGTDGRVRTDGKTEDTCLQSTPGSVSEECRKPSGCVVVDGVVHKRIRPNGRVVGTGAVEQQRHSTHRGIGIPGVERQRSSAYTGIKTPSGIARERKPTDTCVSRTRA